MRVIVTADHIKRGIPGSTGCCPLALAVQDASGYPYAWVGHELVAVRGLQRQLPRIAFDFREKFDADEEVQPFEFDLEL